VVAPARHRRAGDADRRPARAHTDAFSAGVTARQAWTTPAGVHAAAGGLRVRPHDPSPLAVWVGADVLVLKSAIRDLVTS
jgi:hypothetical protein